MMVMKIMGGLGNQIAQYAFGRCCAARLGVALKLDITSYRSYTLHAYGLDQFALRAELASDAEISAAQACGIVQESTLLFEPSISTRVKDGVYLSGYWGDYRYSQDSVSELRTEFQPCAPLETSNLAVLNEIWRTESVSLHIRRGDYVTNPNCLLMPLTYYEDALREVNHRLPHAHVFVFSDDLDWVEKNLALACPHTFVRGNDASRNVDDFQLMRSCRHHIVANSTFSFWATMLGEQGGLRIAPQQFFRPGDPYLIQTFGGIDQPVWPPDWLVMPLRRPLATGNPYLGIAGGHSASKPIRVGVWNYYEELTTDGFIFKNTNASIGHDLLKPWGDLHAYGQAHGIHFVTLDQVTGPEELDAVIFQDRPRMDNPMVARLLNADIAKYLCLFETEIIKPDNWDTEFHKRFDRLFTWSDAHVDHRRFVKTNFAIDPESPYDFEVLKTAFHQRKLCTLIAGAKAAQHPNELYSERLRAIQWFQTNAPQDFDLYGFGWNPEAFPSYRGTVQDKLATLARYRFAICYENARNYPGYITEKILDCFRAGVVPVYLGAPNMDQWIPRDCYIDRNDFPNEQALYTYLSSMGAETHCTYLDRIRDLLASPKFYPFTTECFITTLTSLVARDVKARRGESPDVTVAIPTYNYGKYLPIAVESALSQDVANLEVLVFDNASTDATQAVLARFQGDSRLRCMKNTRNIGGPHNWNNAFQASAGRYITVLSADDFFLPGHLNRMLQTMDAHPSVALAYCPCIWVDEAGNQLQTLNHRGHAAGDYVGGRNEVAELLAFDSYITPSAALIRRSAFDLVGKIDDSLRGGGDWDLWIRMAEKTPDFAFFKTPLVCYRIHAGQDTVTQVSQAYTLIDHIDILWNALERGSLPLFHTKAAEILALLKFKFNAYPREFVAPLQAHMDALELILAKSPGVDIRAERRKAGQPPQAFALASIDDSAIVAPEGLLVSVIVPTCNRPEFLDRSLRSICAQSYPNVEIIVVNDAGCSVAQVIEKHNTTDNIQYLVHETNKGAAAARNTGLRQAKGDYIAYLDDDDEYLPEHLSVILSALAVSDARFAYSRAEYLIETELDAQPQVERQRPFSNIEYSRDLLMIGNFIPTPTWVFERSLLAEVGYFDESFKAWEDWEWLVRASEKTDFLSIPKVTVEVHQRSNDKEHLGVKHRPEMRKWFELVYAMHPAQTPELMKARSAHLKRLFPDRDDAPGDTRRNPDERLEDSVFVAARQGTLDIIDLINNAEGLVNEQRPDLAAELYLQWLDHAKSPLLYAAAFNLGTVLEGVGDYSEAEQAYRRALAHNPLFVHAHFGLALLLERRGNADEAAIHWHWLTQEENGVATSHQGMYEKALAIMEHSKP